MKTKAQKFVVFWVTAWTILTGLLPTQAGTLSTNASSAQTAIPYVPTRHDAVRDLLWLADVGTNDVVYDLGSGDGRVVIAAVRDFHARKAVGIEINPDLVRESRQNAAKAGVAGRVQFIQGDLFTNDFSEASVAVLYLGHGANLDLRAQLIRSLKPGARIVAHQFGMGEWPADKALDVRMPVFGMYGRMFNEFRGNPDVPDYESIPGPPGHDALAEWIVPAPVAGIWRGTIQTESNKQELKLTLHQQLSRLNGSIQLEGSTNANDGVQADLWGTHISFFSFSYGRFDGYVDGDRMNGTLDLHGHNGLQWTAHRDKADFAGTWEWTGAMGTPVQLKIEQRGGHWRATYTDPDRKAPVWAGGNQPIPVADFYDFTGGFYFTLLLGLEGGSHRDGSRIGGPEMGWLVGEAVVKDNSLAGKIAFYPYRNATGNALTWPDSVVRTNVPIASSAARSVVHEGWRDWRPKRVTP